VGCVQACVSEWSLSTLPSPILELQHAPLPFKVLWTRERASTPPLSVVLYLDSLLSPSRSWECVILQPTCFNKEFNLGTRSLSSPLILLQTFHFTLCTFPLAPTTNCTQKVTLQPYISEMTIHLIHFFMFPTLL
jgi:hypothetical protein